MHHTLLFIIIKELASRFDKCGACHSKPEFCVRSETDLSRQATHGRLRPGAGRHLGFGAVRTPTPSKFADRSERHYPHKPLRFNALAPKTD